MGGGLISGKKGESLFHEPLMRFFRENPIPELLGKTSSLKDDRLLAIVSALVIEDRLDKALSSFLPRYERLNDSGFNVARKIALMDALALIPSRILDVASLFQKIRNEFAHNLDLEFFEDLAPKFITSVKDNHHDILSALSASDNKADSTFTEKYKFLGFFCVVGLDSYCENLSYLRTHIETPEFIEALFTKSHAENMTQINVLLAKPPIGIEKRDGHRIKVYETGAVTIEADDGSAATPKQAP